MFNYISFLIVFVSLLFISACEKKEVKNETLKIAAIEPLSGPYAAVGQDLVDQLTFYADLVNSNGGLKDGKKIEIIALDNAMKAEKTTELLRKSIDEGIRFVTQGAGSNHALNIIKQLEKYNSRNPGKEVLFLNHSAVTTTFTNELCTFYHFRFDANVDMKVAALVTQLSKDQDIKKVYLINQNYAYGQSFQKAAKKFLKERAPNIEIVGDELIQPFGKVQDFNPYVTKIKVSEADAILTGNWGPDAYRLVNSLADSGIKSKIYGIYVALPTGMPVMGEKAVYNPIIQVKETHENDSDIPDWLKNINDLHLEQTTMSMDTDRFRFMMEMFAEATKISNSFEPKDIALALEGMKGRGAHGEVLMRKQDHQIHFDIVAGLVSNKIEKPIQYRGENFGMAYSTVGKISKEDVTLETTCEMKRP